MIILGSMKKFLFSIAIVLSLFLAKEAFAQQANVNMYLFWGDGCPHCAKEKEALPKLQEKYPQLKVYLFEVYYNKENVDKFINVAEALGTKAVGVPFTVIGDKYFSGFDEKTSVGMFEEQVSKCLSNGCEDKTIGLLGIEAPVKTNPSSDGAQNPANGSQANPESDLQPTDDTNKVQEKAAGTIRFPILGEIDPHKFSLPLLTIVIGGLDGFNPCAMWVLVFLITLLLGMEDRKRMWLLGGTFIASSAFVYFLFMAAWLNLILFLGFIVWVRIAVGLIAIGAGMYCLKDFFTNTGAVCKVVDQSKKMTIQDRMKNAVHKNSLILALAGIIVLAFAVNLVELVCSAGFPAVYTQVLALRQMPEWQYYAYLLLYILVFMLDDLVVFGVAMVTLRITGLTGKYTRISRLVGGILMFVIGLLLMFKPGWLMF
jgi:thiol-disulfide isomerase/thioredoxin